jgi:hypothetical protein
MPFGGPQGQVIRIEATVYAPLDVFRYIIYVNQKQCREVNSTLCNSVLDLRFSAGMALQLDASCLFFQEGGLSNGKFSHILRL